jgi:hypothetical protein
MSAESKQNVIGTGGNELFNADAVMSDYAAISSYHLELKIKG